jgi:abortive infection bacteriophage resistance protein
MKYTKAPLSFQDQARLLQSRGICGDLTIIENRLGSVNYYRLTGYLHPYKIPGDENFLPGTQFDTVWNHYAFDRRLRLLVMDAIERIEIAVRSQLAYYHAHEYHDPFAYATSPITLPSLKPAVYSDFLSRVREETDRCEKDLFVSHFKTKYGDTHKDLPIWMAVEIMSFGAMQLLFRGASHKVKQHVASHFGMPDRVFDSWLHTLSVIRNICAHHGRLWNKVLGVKPLIPFQKDYPNWHTPYTVPNDRVFAVLIICRYCLKIIAPQSRWPLHMKQLLSDFPMVNIGQMGFPSNWQSLPIWK